MKVYSVYRVYTEYSCSDANSEHTAVPKAYQVRCIVTHSTFDSDSIIFTMLEEPGPHPDSITEIGIKGIRGEPARVLRGLWKDPLMRGRIKALQKHDPPPGGWRRVFGQAVAQRRIYWSAA